MINESVKTKLSVIIRVTDDNKASIEVYAGLLTPDVYETLMTLYELIADKYEITIKKND